MPIRFFEAYGYIIGSYTEGIPEPVVSRIQKTIKGIEQVLPGIEKAMEVSNLGFVYDDKNRHGVFTSSHRGHRGSYYWPLHLMYLSNSGIKKSIAHEAAHMLDMLSGPTLEETKNKYGRELVWPRSLYGFFPKGGKIIPDEIQVHFNPESNFCGWFLVKAAANCTICRENQEVKEGLLNKFSSTDWTDFDTREFLVERTAHLMEEYIFVLQQEANIAPLGVSGVKYFTNDNNKHLWWGKEWIKQNRNEIQNFFNQMIKVVLERNNTGELEKRIKEMQNVHFTGISSVLDTDDLSPIDKNQ